MFLLLHGKGFKRFSCDGSRLVPPKVNPAGDLTPLANAAIDIPPVITVDVIKPVSTIPGIILNRFIFLAFCSRTSILSKKNVSISVSFSSRYVYGFSAAVGFEFG